MSSFGYGYFFFKLLRSAFFLAKFFSEGRGWALFFFTPTCSSNVLGQRWVLYYFRRLRPYERDGELTSYLIPHVTHLSDRPLNPNGSASQQTQGIVELTFPTLFFLTDLWFACSSRKSFVIKDIWTSFVSQFAKQFPLGFVEESKGFIRRLFVPARPCPC